MGTLGKGYTFGATEEVTAAKLHTLVDSGTVTGIVADDITDNTITAAKIQSVSGAAFTLLGSIPSGAGVIPAANLTSVAQKGANSDITSITGLTTPLDETLGGTGQTTFAQGDILYASGANTLAKLAAGTSGYYLKTQGAGANPTWATIAGREVFTADDTFTAPAGVTRVYVTMCGGGGGGGGANNDGYGGGGGGGGGASCIRVPYTVVPSSEYAVVVGTKGTGGTTANGNAGEASSFNTSLSVAGGSGGQGGTGASTHNGGAGGTTNLAASGITAGKPAIAGGAGAAGSTSNYGGGGGGSLCGAGAAGRSTMGNGIAATDFGGGGGGGLHTPGQGGTTGGNGADGIVIVEW